MRRTWFGLHPSWIAALPLVAALGLGAGCASPCHDVAVEICVCWKGEDYRDTCGTLVDYQQSQTPPTDAQEAQCKQVNDAGTCTCDAALAHDSEACGFVEVDVDGGDGG
jgi:hypothetical protein